MSAIENYWYAVQRRVDEPATILAFNTDRDAQDGSRDPALLPGVSTGGLMAAPEIDTDNALSSTFQGPPRFYFYKSIRFRKDQGEWGVFIVTGGRDHVAERFAPYCSSVEDARRVATEFLMACGKAHYRFDLFAMSLEATLQHWLYVPYLTTSRSANAPRLETAYVHQAAMEWAAKHGMTSPVAKILERWTTDTAVHSIPRRSLGAYLATALTDGFGALSGPARYDQADWANTIPDAFLNECPGPHILKGQLPAESAEDTEPSYLTPEAWLSRWGVQNYTRFESGDYYVDGNLTVFGDAFPQGKFPLRIREITGNFICQETNLSTVDGLPRSVGGQVDIARNRQLRNFRRIHRHLTSVYGGVVRVSEECVECAVLGLLRIEGVSRIEATRDAGKPAAKSWVPIVNRHLPIGDIHHPALIECQNELISAGLENHGAI